MPQLRPQENNKVYELCPRCDGETVRLADIKIVTNAPTAQFNPGEDRQRFIFETTNLYDAEGRPFKLFIHTGMSYGNEKATLTWLLDRVCPNATEEEKEMMNTDDLIGEFFIVNIMHKKRGVERNPDGTPKMTAIIDSIRPAPHQQNDNQQPQQRPAPLARVGTAAYAIGDDADPWADEE